MLSHTVDATVRPFDRRSLRRSAFQSEGPYGFAFVGPEVIKGNLITFCPVLPGLGVDASGSANTMLDNQTRNLWSWLELVSAEVLSSAVSSSQEFTESVELTFECRGPSTMREYWQHWRIFTISSTSRPAQDLPPPGSCSQNDIHLRI
jgi:hypothetical protein